ncbi:uro-adherence factor A [Centroberyx affinis]|uniref:uro-adherence factor A n=1 Tax=Centroberyx affinis TaxID=166261 RepID=UPI003A5BB002
MENTNGGASIKGVLVPVPESSELFHNNILAPLQSAYLYEESKQSFRYKSAFLINNPALEEQYKTFRAKRRDAGYSSEDLKESYGFLLFDDANKANKLGETGVPTGNSTCTTLGDPSKGVYISTYSDCLDLNRWYHGKSGYIAIIRLTKGRVKTVSENYTQNLTTPSVGFDCHVSKQFSAVSANTSSFLAFERTQYYMYELLHDGGSKTAQSPSHACPIAIVSFSYTDTKATALDPQEKSEEEKIACHYLPWRGQLQISTQFYDVGLKCTTGALIPAKLPAVVKVDRAISMLDLRRLLPKAVFETCFSGEVSLDDICCSLCELVSSEAEDSSLSLLIQQLKEKDLALTVQLNDGGFLILLHSSHFLTYDDAGSSTTEALQGMFVFPESRAIQRDTKGGQKMPAISSEILQVLPALNYAENEMEKRSIPSEELCGLLAQHMQSYAALINPGLAASPSREVSIFPDQYDVPDALKQLYSAPKWTNRAWQSFRSYLSQPVSFQLPVSRASELLAAGQEERREDLDDEVYICLSSPEEAPASPASMGSQDQFGGQESPAHVETFVDSHIATVEAKNDSTIIPPNEVPDDLQAGDATKDIGKPGLAVLTKTDILTGAKNLLISPTSRDLPTELIVSITSAEGTAGVIDESLSMISAVSATKHHDIELSDSSAAKLQTAGVNSLNDKTDKAKNALDLPEVGNKPTTKTHWKKRRKGRGRGSKKSSKSCVQTSSLETVKLPVEADNSMSEEHDKTRHPSDHSGMNKPSKIDWRKLRRRRRKGGKLSSKNKKVRSAAVKLMEKEPETMESTILTEHEAHPLRKKTERWDLKPIITKCGRILVPHGAVDFADQIRSLKDTHKSPEDEQCPDKMMVEAPVKALETTEIEQEPSPALETTQEKMETTKAMDGGSHLQNIVVSPINSEHSESRQSDDGNGSITWKPDTSSDYSSENVAEAVGADTLPSEAVQKKHTDAPSPVKSAKMGALLLSKLKSVLLKGKRKTPHLMSEAVSPGSAQGTEPCLKKSKGDSDMEMLKTNDSIRCVLDTSVGAEEVSQTLSIDPKFAEALGLTPKAMPDKVQKTQCQDTQLRRDSSSIQEQTISDKQPQTIQRPSSILTGKGRMKTLKKHQDVSSEYIKKKCTSFQVPPLNGSAGLQQQHHQNMYGDEIQALQAIVCQEDKSGHKHGASAYLTKDMARRRKFRHSRTFVDKDGSIQVTRQWKENYDFNLDSKFTNDPKDKTVVRALHGPWDFSIHDTSEEVRLIVHMWIGLFYSRSTARFFHIDTNFTCPYSEESDCLEMSSGIIPAPTQSEVEANSSAHLPTITSDTSISKVLDLSKKDAPVVNQGSAILDLTLRNPSEEIATSDPQVNRKEIALSREQTEATETSEAPKLSMGLHEASTSCLHQAENQSYRERVDSIDISELDDDNDVKSINENESKCPSPKADAISSKSDGTFILLSEEMANVCIQPENVLGTPGIVHVLHGSNNEKKEVRDCGENRGTTEMDLVQQVGIDSAKTMEDREVDSNCDSADLVHTAEHDENERKDKPYQEDNVESSPPVIHISDDSTNKESDTVCDANLLKNEVHLAEEESKALSPDQDENVNEDRNHHPVHDGSVIRDEVHLGMEHGIDVKGNFVSVVNAGSDLNDKPLPMMCGSPGSIEEDCDAECNGKVALAKQPPQVDSENDACSDSQLRVPCANGNTFTGEDTISVQVPHAALDRPSHMENIDNESVDEVTSETISDICSADEVHSKKAALPMTDENTHSVGESCTTIPQTTDGTVEESQNEVKANFCDVSSSDNEDQDNKSVESNQSVNPIKSVDFHDQSPSSHSEVMQNDQVGMPLVKEADVKKDVKDERSEKMHGQVVIPFLEIEPSRQDTLDPQVLNLHDEVEELVQGQKEIPFIRETNCHEGSLHTEVNNTSQEHSEKTLLCAGKMTPVVDLSESNQPMVCRESGSDDRCPTPTLDEKPYYHMLHPDPCSSTSASSGDDVCKNVTRKDLSRCSTPTNDELPLEQELCSKSRVINEQVNNDPNPGLSLGQEQVHPDLELRTLRVLRSIDKYFCKSSHIDKSSQLETADLHLSWDQTPSPSSKYVPTNLAPSHISTCYKEEKINDMKPEVVLASAKQELHAKALHHFKSPFKSKFSSEEELSFHVQLQPKETDSSIPEHYSRRTEELQDTSFGQDSFYPYKTSPSECVQAVHPSIDQEKHNVSLQYNLGHEPRSCSQRPIMAVKPSKSDESQADYNSKEGQIDTSAISTIPRNKQTKIPVVTNTTLSTMFIERQAESFKGMSEGLNENEKEGIEFSSKANWVSNDQDVVGKFKLDEAKLAILDALYQYKGREISNLNKIPSSSVSMQSIESGKSSTRIVDGNQDLLKHCLVEKIGQTTEDIEIDEEDHSVAVTASVLDYEGNTVTDDSLILEPSTSTLTCTVFNSSRKRPYCLVEQLSQRCLQHDLTQSSMEQECLIFSEQMKQLLKKSKRGPSYNQDNNYDRSKLSCTSPVTVHFSSLEEQEDSVDHLEALPLLVGQKIKVDMHERRGLADNTEEENTLHLQKLAHGKGNPTGHIGVSDVTAECARVYESMMNDVCAGKKLPSKTKRSRMDSGFPKSDLSDHFDFSGQTKREMYESFHSNLNSVVRQSCKTKFRFYIVVTTDDAFFDETKVR